MQAVQHRAEEDRLGTVGLKLCEDCAKAVLRKTDWVQWL